ncbi:response regulator [Oscillatoria sp. CS-180]|uniref:response regulator transcription factor n=1 Tax=Oscillatoria sp. CS-180 TaxID=3021720 RepID=UPI00232DEDFE|nr:response regulator [Oscillatoria sp. CS-180]MDB9528785.1 response regulator [Oscillatoria sp. CS-180]
MSTALIVEDSLTDKELLALCLKDSGIDVRTATNAEEAFDQVKNNQFDIIILDIVLPDRSGFEICRELKEDEATKKVPVIICSTKGSDMDKFWGMKQGADAYLAKPINHEELIRAVRQLVD